MNQTGPKEKSQKELPNEVRMVIAFVLMGVILVATPYAYRKFGLVPPEPPKKTAVAKTDPAKTLSASPAQTQQPEAAPGVPAAPANPVGANAEQTFTIDTALYDIVLSNRGGVVKSWTL